MTVSVRPTLFLAVPLLLLQAGCSHNMLQSSVKEGTIEYALTFPDYDPNGLMAGMLPEKTTLSFTEDKQAVDLSAGMGVFRTSMVVNTPEQIMDYHMSVMGKKMVAELHPRDLQQFNRESEALSILYTNETDTIAGYPCKKAVAIYNGIDHPESDIWYTTAITMETPNWYGPYSEIPGVLMQYEVIQYGMRMQLTATAVKPGPVDGSHFIVQPDHEHVAPEVLHQELAEVLGTFSN